MENLPNNENNTDSKLLYDINEQNNNEEYSLCPHILGHNLNPFLNKKFNKIDISQLESNPVKKSNKYIYARNLFLIENKIKSFNYYGYSQAKNLFNSFLLKNFTIDSVLINNPQNLSFNSMNRNGCIFSMNFNDTGNLLITSNHNKTIEVWDVHDKTIKKTMEPHSEVVTSAEFFHGQQDNEYFISCSLDKTIKLWKNYTNIHTFYEHSDWVRSLAIRHDNHQFLSGCVSSVTKLWDIPSQRVIGSFKNNFPDPWILSTVNSLSFMNNNPYTFIVAFRDGDVKIFDSRIKSQNDEYIKNIGLVHSFKAHFKKLNMAKLNHSDNYLLTSSRESSLRLWDMRKLPSEKDNEESIKKNKLFINEYNKHKCVGYNIECSFYNNEQYIMTGSESNHIYIYDIYNNNKFYKFKTQHKCTNLVKQIPNTYNIAYTGLEDISIYIWNAQKSIKKYFEKNYLNKSKEENSEENTNEANEEINIDDIEETGGNKNLGNKFIEEIMCECGDTILKIFHNHNLTYTTGINFSSLLEIIRSCNDKESENLLNLINEKILKKVWDNFIEGFKNHCKNNEENKEQKISKNKKKPIKIISCSNCEKCEKKGEQECLQENINSDKVNNIYEDEKWKNFLILPNNFGFNSEK